MAFRIFNSILSVNILMASLLLFLISVHAGIFCCRFHFLFPCFLWPRGVCYVLEFAKEKKQCKGGWYAYWTEVGSAWALQGQLFATTVWTCHLNFSDVSASYHPYHRPTSLPLEKWIWGIIIQLAGQFSLRCVSFFPPPVHLIFVFSCTLLVYMDSGNKSNYCFISFSVMWTHSGVGKGALMFWYPFSLRVQVMLRLYCGAFWKSGYIFLFFLYFLISFGFFSVLYLNSPYPFSFFSFLFFLPVSFPWRTTRWLFFCFDDLYLVY